MRLNLIRSLVYATVTPLAFTVASPAQEQRSVVQVSGRVVTWDGKPIGDAAVAIGREADLTTTAVLREPLTRTDTAGRFTVAVAAPAAKDRALVELQVAQKGFAAVRLPVPWRRQGEPPTGTPPAAMEYVGPDDPQAPPFVFATATDVGDVVLAPGQRLTGRLRDPMGKPLANVLVCARDQLELGDGLRAGRQFGFHCATRSNATGIFDLPCTLPNAVVVTFTLDGYYRERLAAVAAGQPLEVTLQPSGWIQGRVLDREGHSIADAAVSVHYELGSGHRVVALRSGPDGSFRTGLERPGRWRVLATRHQDRTHATGHSEVLRGPRENLEVLVDIDAQAQRARLPIRAVRKADGQPVVGCRAAAVWEEYAQKNTAYLDYRFGWLLRAATVSPDGNCTVEPPEEGEPTIGTIRVVGAGYAPATRREVEWQAAAAGGSPEPVVIELEPEATVHGVLRDVDSGQPVAGAAVLAIPRHDPSQGTYGDPQLPAEAPHTAADGTFTLTGLGEGAWDVVVLDPRRPPIPPTPLDLAAAEHRTGLEIRAPGGAVVAGTLRNAPLGHGAGVLLARLPKQTFGDEMAGSHVFFRGSGQDRSHLPAELAADGTFRFQGVPLDNHLLVLRLPSPPRLGGDLYLPLEPFRVRAAGVQREFDCQEDRPGTIRGTLQFPQAEAPAEYLVVVARPQEEAGQQVFSPFGSSHPGPRSFVTSSREYSIRVGPGAYQLTVLDLRTGVALHDEATRIEVRTGATTTRDLRIDLREITVERVLAADQQAMAESDRLEIRVIPKAMREAGMMFGGNEEYDNGQGMPWPADQPRLTLQLPLGNATFLCRNNVMALRVDDNRWNNPPIGRAELEIDGSAAAKTNCPIPIEPPRAIPDAKAQPDNAAVDATTTPANGDKQ